MSATTIQQNIIRGLGEAGAVANATTLTHALRFANQAYRDMWGRYRFKTLRTRSIFRTAIGQQTYQAPSDFAGFLVLKDETNSTVLQQVTPEEFQRELSVTVIEDETFTSSDGVAVALANTGIVQYSETICDDADQTTTYTRDTDYTMAYPAGTITVDAAEAMADATTYYANYLYYTEGPPTKFCVEFDATNKQYIFRLDPVPDAVYIASCLYSAVPAVLSGSVDSIWAYFEFAIERGGIYYGSLEWIEDAQKRMEFKGIYEVALQALIQLDQELIPKRTTIPVVMRKSDY